MNLLCSIKWKLYVERDNKLRSDTCAKGIH